MTIQPLLQLQPRQPDQQCTHSALRSSGQGRWQCVICETDLTDLDLVNQRNERRAKTKQKV